MIWYTVRWSDNRFAKLSFFLLLVFWHCWNQKRSESGRWPLPSSIRSQLIRHEKWRITLRYKSQATVTFMNSISCVQKSHLTMGSTETKLERARMWAGYKTKSSKQFKINRYRNKREQKNYSREWPIPGHLSFISIKSKTKRISIFFSSSFS